jgi:hypothetical protein
MLVNEYRLEIQFKKVQKIRNINNIPMVGSRPLECKHAQTFFRGVVLVSTSCIKDHVKSVLRIRSAQAYIPMVRTRPLECY